jgi:hypothetical protein
MTFSEISDENTNLQINIGDKVSILFDQSKKLNSSSKELAATLIIEPQESIQLDLEDKVWIQIGENIRVFGRKADKDNDSQNGLLFDLDNIMIDDFKMTKMMYAGVNHPHYNLKSKEINTSVIKELAKQL